MRFGDKKVYLSCRNGGPKVKSVTINGKLVKVESPDAVVLKYNELPIEAKVEIITEGGWTKEVSTTPYPIIPALIEQERSKAFSPANLPDSLHKPFTVLSKMGKYLANDSGAEYERAFVTTAIESFEAYQYRTRMEVGSGYFRPIDQLKKETIMKLYANSALAVYKGFEKQMESYAQQGDSRQKRIASLFFKAQ